MPRGQATNNGNTVPDPEAQTRWEDSWRCCGKTMLLILVAIILDILLLFTVKLYFFTERHPNSFSAYEQNEFVKWHNWFRGNVSPPATNMRKVVWDKDVAKWAQRFADRCLFGHGDLGGEFGGMGQNTFAGGGENSGRGATGAWYGEGRFYTYANNSCKKGEVCGHFIQVVAAGVSRIGCARSRGGCLKGGTIVCCNYVGGGGGNAGGRPYESNFKYPDLRGKPTPTTANPSDKSSTVKHP